MEYASLLFSAAMAGTSGTPGPLPPPRHTPLPKRASVAHTKPENQTALSFLRSFKLSSQI